MKFLFSVGVATRKKWVFEVVQVVGAKTDPSGEGIKATMNIKDSFISEKWKHFSWHSS